MGASVFFCANHGRIMREAYKIIAGNLNKWSLGSIIIMKQILSPKRTKEV